MALSDDAAAIAASNLVMAHMNAVGAAPKPTDGPAPGVKFEQVHSSIREQFRTYLRLVRDEISPHDGTPAE